LADLAIPSSGGDPFIPPDLSGAFPGGLPKSGYQFTITGGTGAEILPLGDACNGTGSESEFFAIGDRSRRAFQASATSPSIIAAISGRNLDQLGDMTEGAPLQ
jgi:hypothetical protein